MRLKKEVQPLAEERTRFQDKLVRLEWWKDSKIPAYDKIDKNSTMYKHIMQLMFNKEIADTAGKQMAEDREMLKDINDTIVPPKKIATKEVDEEKKVSQR